MKKINLIILTVIIFFINTLTYSADWPMYMGNFYMTGNNDEVPPDSNRLNWVFKAPKYVTNAVTANLNVFVTSVDGYIYAVNEETGRIRWHFNTGKPIFAMPVIGNGYVITSSGRKLFCLREQNGSIIWARFDPNFYSQFGTPIIYKNRVIYGTRKVLYARKLRNGHELWTNSSLETYGASPVLYDNIVVVSGKSYRGSNTSFLVAINADSGETLWKTRVEHDPNTFTPLIKDGKIYYGSANYFYCINLRTGNKIYAKRFTSNFGSEPKYSNQLIYISGTDGNIYVLNPKNGGLKKKIKHYSRQGTRFIMVGPNIYTTTDKGYLYSIAGDTGRVKWKFKARHTRRGKILCAANGRAYFTVFDRVYSLSKGALPTTERPRETAPTINRLAQNTPGNNRPHSRYNSNRYRPRYGSPYNRNRRYRPRYRSRYSRNRYGTPYSRYRRNPNYRRNYPRRRVPSNRNNPDNRIARRIPDNQTPPVTMARPRDRDIEPPAQRITKPRKKPIRGRIVDSRTGKPIRGEIIAIPSNDPQGRKRIVIPVGPDGSFDFNIPNDDYDITFRSPGYSFSTIPLKKKKKWKKKIVKLVKLRRGSSFVVHNIFFDVHKATLKPTSIKELRRAVKLLRENPSMKIRIVGHTDSTGNKKYNFYFSKKRAEVVRNFLIKHGINPRRLKIHGAGPTKPIAPNSTAAGRARNRRVEFEVLNM